jgi:hypothetical protein
MGKTIFAGLAAAWSLLACSSPAVAEPATVDQVELLDVEAGEAELELQWIAIPAQDGAGSSLGAGLTAEFAVSDRVALGIEIGAARAGGDTEVEEVSAQIKWVAVAPDEANIGLGLQAAVGYSLEEEAVETELNLIAEAQRGPLGFTANLIFTALPGAGEPVDVRYGLRVDRATSGPVALALEAGGVIAAEGVRGHWIGPALELAPFGEDEGAPSLDFSWFAGLGRDAPDHQLRLEIDWAF